MTPSIVEGREKGLDGEKKTSRILFGGRGRSRSTPSTCMVEGRKVTYEIGKRPVDGYLLMVEVYG